MKKMLMIALVFLFVLAGFLGGCTEEVSDKEKTSDLLDDSGNNDLQNNSDDDVGYDDDSYDFPPIDTSTSFPEIPVEGELKTVSLGDLEISYFDTVYAHTVYFLGGDLFIDVENKGSSSEVVYSSPSGEPPSWNMHFFSFQNTTNVIGPGETKRFHYFCSLDSSGSFNLSFSFWQESDESDKVSFDVMFYSESNRIDFPSNALIYGTVYDKETNQPLENVEVESYFYTGRERAWRENTNDKGQYYLQVPSTSDLVSYFGSQKLAYDSLNHFVFVDYSGYEYFYSDDITLDSGGKYKLDIYLEPVENQDSYSLDWDEKVSDHYGFFWLNVDDEWDNCFATQAKHPPELFDENDDYVSTNVYMFDVSTGNQEWSYPVNSECWGSDITSDGSFCAAGSHDTHTYVIESDSGELGWQADSGGMNRWVEFSNDDNLLLTGPVADGNDNYDFGIYNVSTGVLEKKFSYGEWIRNSCFSKNDEVFVVGMGGGNLAMYETGSGQKIWEQWVGEFPLFLEIDDDKNVYATGKGRTLFSYDSNGMLRWSLRIPDHTITSGVISADGNRLYLGSVGSWVYCVDSDSGEIIWRHKQTEHSETVDKEISTVGHNAVSISDCGNYLAVGAGPANHLTVFNKKGTTLFEHTSDHNTDSILDDKWATIGGGASEGSQKGIICTVISNNGERIIAGYGDNYVRSFTKN